MKRNGARSRALLLFGFGSLLLLGAATVALASNAPQFVTQSPANECAPGVAQFKGRVTHVGNGRIVLEDPRVLTHDPIPEDEEHFWVFMVEGSTLVTDARGNSIDLECLEPLSWALVEVSSGQENERYSTALRICAVDLQTHLDAMEEPAVEH